MTEATQDTLITPEMAACVGRDYYRAKSFPIAASDIRKWAMGVYYPEKPPRLYWDEDYARQTRWGGIVAPEEFNPFAWMADEPREPSKFGSLWPEPHFGVEPPQSKANVLVRVEMKHTAVRMRPGDVITLVKSLQSYDERTGRLGLMLFTKTEERWTNQNDELVRTFGWTFIRYR